MKDLGKGVHEGILGDMISCSTGICVRNIPATHGSDGSQADYIAALQSHHAVPVIEIGGESHHVWWTDRHDGDGKSGKSAPGISHAAVTSQVMLAAVKCKQNVDPALADALDGAVAEMSKMQLVPQLCFVLC